MREKTSAQKWLAPVVWTGIAVFAAFRSPMLFLLLGVLLPPIAATLAYTSGTMQTAVLCAAFGALNAYLLPGEALWIVLPWCVLSGVIACVPFQKKLARPIAWGALVLAAWCGSLLLLSQVYEGQIVTGLAQSFCDWVNESPERDTILINCYSMGLSRLEGTETWNLLMRVTGVMAQEIRLQLLYSLRVSIEETLPSVLCEGLVYHVVLTVLLCTLLPDWRRRKNGEPGLLPSMDKWYMPRGIGLGVLALCLGWLIATMSDGGVEMYFGLLCMAVFRSAYMLQGVCLLMWMEKKAGVHSAVRNVWAVVLSVLAPIVPLIMGLVDQRRDSRNLRPKEVHDL